MRPLITRYPNFLAGSAEFCDIQQALEPELLELWAARDSVLNQLCVETATWGLEYWERTLGIPVDEGADLDSRRSRVRVKLLGADVTTVALIRSAAEIYSGGPAEVLEFAEQFRFEIDFAGVSGVPANIRDLIGSLREIVPAHLGWGFRFSTAFQGSLQVGGHPAVIVRIPVPEAEDDLRFESAAGIGGGMAAIVRLPVPEKI